MKATLNNGWQFEGTPAELYELQAKFDAAKKADKAIDSAEVSVDKGDFIYPLRKAPAEAEPKPTPKFKEGDKVHIIGNNGPTTHYCEKGEIGTVLRTQYEGDHYVKFDKFGQWVSPADLELYVESSPITRAAIVAQAKRDVADLRRSGKAHGGWWDYRQNLSGESDFGKGSGHAYRAEFIVNREKRTVTVLFRDYLSGTRVVKKATAKAAPDDVFNAHIGKAIALRRALGLDVPDEYLNAPKPEGVAVGDVIYLSFVYPRETVGHEHNSRKHLIGIKCAQLWYGEKKAKVIDDTDRVESDAV